MGAPASLSALLRLGLLLLLWARLAIATNCTLPESTSTTPTDSHTCACSPG
jgi:hypothetical protein